MASMLLPLSLCCFFLLVCHGSLAQFGEGSSTRRLGAESECRLEKLSAQVPTRSVESEAGVTEYFDQDNDQFRCAGVAAHRRIIRQNGLLSPSYSNSPRVVYISQGEGICSVVLPGCPETYQSFHEQEQREQEEERESPRDQHQRIHRIRQGDVFVVPAGVAYWCYNDGDSDVVSITVMDTSNNANQLDRNRRQFLLAGSQRQQEGEEGSARSNILSGFASEILAGALGVGRDLVQKLQKVDENKGEIVRVEGKLSVIRPPRREQEEKEKEREEEKEKERESESKRKGKDINGLEQALCNMRFRQNIDNPSRADVYNPQGGRLTTVNSNKLRILDYIQMSVAKGVLHKNAILVPHWNINAHNIMYVTRGSARVQIVGDRGRSVFDGELRKGQLVIIPQNFAVVKQARSERFEWISFMTHGNAIQSPLAGRSSVFRGFPEDVIVNSYRGISREEARMVKNSRKEEEVIVVPRSQEGRSDA